MRGVHKVYSVCPSVASKCRRCPCRRDWLRSFGVCMGGSIGSLSAGTCIGSRRPVVEGGQLYALRRFRRSAQRVRGDRVRRLACIRCGNRSVWSDHRQ
jgi:hypothetical protein